MKKVLADRHFEILGITRAATPKQIKEAFRQQMKLWHPDRFGDRPEQLVSALERSKLINEAYELLQSYVPPRSIADTLRKTQTPRSGTRPSKGNTMRPGHVRVMSSNIYSIGYDHNKQVLQVQFLNESIYEYYDVPSQVHSDLINASSKGRYLMKFIAGRYPYKNVY